MKITHQEITKENIAKDIFKFFSHGSELGDYFLKNKKFLIQIRNKENDISYSKEFEFSTFVYDEIKINLSYFDACCTKKRFCKILVKNNEIMMNFDDRYYDKQSASFSNYDDFLKFYIENVQTYMIY